MNPIDEALTREDRFRKALFERPQSLSKLLPYDEYSEEGKVFCNKDGSLGIVFEVAPIEHEPLPGKKIVQLVEQLSQWFTLPDNCALQILFEQNHVSSLDECWNQLATVPVGANPVSTTLYEERIRYLKEACGTQSPWSSYRRRVFLSLRYFPIHPKKTGKGPKDLLHRELRQFGHHFRIVRQLADHFERNSKIKLHRMSGEELVDVLRRFFNPVTYYKRPFAPVNPRRSLSDQIIYNSPTLDLASLEREGIKTRTLSLKTTPERAYPGGMAYFLNLSFPFRLSLNISFPNEGEVKRHFNLKEFFLQHTVSAQGRRQLADVHETQERLVRNDRILHVTFNVIVEGTSEEELDDRTRQMVNIFVQDLQSEVIVEDMIGLGLCLNALPLHYHPKADYSSQRAIRIHRADATKFVPIFDSYRGFSKPVQLHVSREHNVVPFTLLANETSNHTVILADSGSGKSAFVVDWLASVKRMTPEPLVFIIDKESSYKMLAQYFEADFTRFDRQNVNSFSPFRGHYDDDKIAVLTNLLIYAITLTSPNFEVESEHRTAIAKAIRLAYAKKTQEAGLEYVDGDLVHRPGQGPAELTMDDIVAEIGALPALTDFETLGPTCEVLVQKLAPFFRDGTYAPFFNQRASRTTKETLAYIYDLDPLDSDPILQSLMTTSVFEEIRQVIRLKKHRVRQKILVLEEFAMVGKKNPIAKEIIIDFAERLRKLGCWIIALTPRPQNYFDLDVGQALWGVADNFVFLKMSDDNVDYLRQKSSLLDEANAQIIKSLRTVRGEHADVFYMNKKKTQQGAFRFIQTPLDRWLAPTNSKDALMAERALEQFGKEKWKALQYLAETYPHGVESAQLSSEGTEAA